MLHAKRKDTHLTYLFFFSAFMLIDGIYHITKYTTSRKLIYSLCEYFDVIYNRWEKRDRPTLQSK